MKRSFYALLATSALILGAAAFFADSRETAAQTADRIAAALPASDAVIVLDMRRLMDESLPQVLSGKPLEMDKINAGIDKFKTETGLDLRQFEKVAVGLAVKDTSAAETDFDPVLLANGKFSPAALVGAAKLAAKAKYREEKLGDRTIYVFAPKDILAANQPDAAKPNPDPNAKPRVPNSRIEKAFDRMGKNLANELAVAVYDNNTLAIGSLARVRETLNSKTRVSAEILRLVEGKSNAVVRFGVNTPQGVGQFYDLEDDEIGKTLKEVRQVSGSLDAAGGSATVSIAAKTAKPENAESLEQMLTGLQFIGKSFIGGIKSDKRETYARLIDNLKIARVSDQVMLDLQVPQSDINVLLGVK